ncbi:hypothetical protein ZWY2020_012452 [Hordeum vulgare]|nr:hypothetical protein ZWY2020_012452 [Hordeum vulgare]
MRHLPDSSPHPCRSAPARQRLANSSTPASVELLQESTGNACVDFVRRGGGLTLLLLEQELNMKRNGTVPFLETRVISHNIAQPRPQARPDLTMNQLQRSIYANNM